ncbi:MAG: hypothetical protein NXI01_05020 [Gammaproteobacteria bacterium]|nr:hypothetical protein [Gammaproteobacteria bacterium]
MTTMNRTVLWGHHLDEYLDMFHLPQAALTTSFLEFQSGASAFQFELKEQAAHLVSYDDWFALDKSALQREVERSFETRLKQIQARPHAFDLTRYGDLEQLVAYRRQGMRQFFQDYDQGHAEGRYLSAAQTALPFEDFFFDYAVSSHYFFLASAPQTPEYHIQTIAELARVAKEVRVFPLVDSQGVPSALLGPVILGLQQKNYGIEVRDVAYHLQPQGNAMLRVWAQQCSV